MWHAKPSGGYSPNTTEYNDNIKECDLYFSAEGFTAESIAGMLGNCYAESNLNPWYWQNNYADMSNGYGLFQFTPASDYIGPMAGVPGYAPNTSVSTTVAGANPSDGGAQLITMRNDYLGKWSTIVWRSYWDANDYPALWSLSQSIVNTFGSNGRLTMDQFRNIDNVEAATFAFLACYEGPAVPNMSDRLNYANAIYPLLDGGGGGGGSKRKMPLYMFLRRRY